MQVRPASIAGGRAISIVYLTGIQTVVSVHMLNVELQPCSCYIRLPFEPCVSTLKSGSSFLIPYPFRGLKTRGYLVSRAPWTVLNFSHLSKARFCCSTAPPARRSRRRTSPPTTRRTGARGVQRIPLHLKSRRGPSGPSTSFLKAGADIIETNSFGSASIVLAEYDIAEQGVRAEPSVGGDRARLRRRVFDPPERPRFVAGSNRTHHQAPVARPHRLRYDGRLLQGADRRTGGGGADLLCIETCQDLLQIKCALSAAMEYFEEIGRKVPVIVSVTIETMGTMLMGTEIAAAVTALEPYDIISVIGMNCATGPKEMEENLRYICQNSPKPVFVMPNAGIPENVGGHAHYHLTPDEMVTLWMRKFVGDFGVGVIGGCCGTTPEHIGRLRASWSTRSRAASVPGSTRRRFLRSTASCRCMSSRRRCWLASVATRTARRSSAHLLAREELRRHGRPWRRSRF